MWESIQGEARVAADYLGRDMEGVLTSRVEGLGEDSVTGATRGRIVEAVETTRALLLSKVLEEVRPKSTRAAWAWRQRDKVSSAWLLAIPGLDTSLSSAEFSEAAAANLSLASPACVGRVGEVIRGRVTVDTHGDNVQATCVPGDHWRLRHNAMLHLFYRLCVWSGLPTEMEVFNLFSGLIRQEGLSRMEWSAQRQGLVPDMRITMPGGVEGGVGGGAGQPRQVLHELKVISCSQSRYRPTCRKRAVDARADLLQAEYLHKARAADRRQGVPAGELGRVEQKLISLGEVQGIVCGNFGELNEAGHSLVSVMATSRVRVAGPSRGRRGLLRGEDGERAIAISSIRLPVS